MRLTNQSQASRELDQWEWTSLPPTNKTLSRRSVAKVLGEFSLKEHLFYAGIFFSMSLIVIFCFLLVNRDNSSSSSLSSAQLSYYDGGKAGDKIACREYFAQIVCKLSNDKTISFISIYQENLLWLFVKFLNVFQCLLSRWCLSPPLRSLQWSSPSDRSQIYFSQISTTFIFSLSFPHNKTKTP